MPNPELSVIVPAHNEAALVGDCLDSMLGQLVAQTTIERTEVIVVASACRDDTSAIATDVLSEYNEVRSEVIDVRKPGKKLALNAGLDVARGDMVLCVDGDVVVTPGAIERAHADMHEPDARLISGQVAPTMLDSWINRKPAPSIDLLVFAKRQVTLPHKSARGGFIGFFRKDLPPCGYSEGGAPDDAWLSAYMGSKFDLDAIRVNEDVSVTYMPPMTLRDLQSQINRYRMSTLLVRREHPELSSYFDRLKEHWAATDGGDMPARWEEKATEYGLDFEKWRGRYDQMVRRADRQAHDKRRLPRRDFWTPSLSTKRLAPVPRGLAATSG